MAPMSLYVGVLFIVCMFPGIINTSNEHVCPNMDIRNTPYQLDALENCTVIEGSLQILLMGSQSDVAEYMNQRSYPKLREITGYLLFYRVNYLKSLSRLFPNLAVIRGQQLFYDYALILFEMEHLEDIGLPSLMTISRGAVRLEKNPVLCYLDTINWDHICAGDNVEHFITENQDINQCNHYCPTECDVDVNNSELGGYERKFCWNQDHCQKFEGQCNTNSVLSCCDEQCLGGCSENTNADCNVCKRFTNHGQCVARCPPGMFEYMSRRCILESECRNMIPTCVNGTIGDEHGPTCMKLFKNTTHPNSSHMLCLDRCPDEYKEDPHNPYGCISCNGTCPRECRPPTVIDSLSTARSQLEGCTTIKGHLYIRIRGGANIGRELTAVFKKLERVTRKVTIINAYGLTSLHFLNNLRVIDGEGLGPEDDALYILKNENLRELWDIPKIGTREPLQIKRGRIFFQENPKLCISKIEQFVEWTNMSHVVTEDMMSPHSNGDEAPCNISNLTLSVPSKSADYIVIQWEHYQESDERNLLHYVVHWTETPYKNITIFDARAACGSAEGWKVKINEPPKITDLSRKYLATVLYNLKPWTQYAVYVETYMVSSSHGGAISELKYVTTLEASPSRPQNVMFDHLSPDHVNITWDEPEDPNGNISSYKVLYSKRMVDNNKLMMRNYCTDRLISDNVDQEEAEDEENESTDTALAERCCTCDDGQNNESPTELERMKSIDFENYLQNSVYVKRPTRSRRSNSPNIAPNIKAKQFRSTLSVDDERTHNTIEVTTGINTTPVYSQFSTEPPAVNVTVPNITVLEPDDPPIEVTHTHVVLKDLKQFQEYHIKIFACHAYMDTEETMGTRLCSTPASITIRTSAIEGVDIVDVSKINHTLNTLPGGDQELEVKWPDPVNSNGPVITYDIELRDVAWPDRKPDSVCIPYSKYLENGGGHTFHSSETGYGEFKYQVLTTTLAGKSTYRTEAKYFKFEHPNKNYNVGMIVGLSVTFGLILILIIVVVVWSIARKFFADKLGNDLVTSANPDYFSPDMNYIEDEWEVDRDKIDLLSELGKGSFGMVYKGTAMDISPEYKGQIDVAVKTVPESASFMDRVEFLNEASVMKRFRCNHVVRLLGVVSRGQPFVIMELMATDLKQFLRQRRPGEEDSLNPPTFTEAMQMAAEIADGMAYLSAEKFVHRDLAARNCMVAMNKVVKIGDFGMARDIYDTDYYRKGGKGLLPVRWMAPESLKDGVFTSQSDVWSFGVVLWEMATLAAQPYQGLCNEEVLKFVIDKGTMEKPEGCPDKLYNYMCKCWLYKPAYRPTFVAIIRDLTCYLTKRFQEESFYYSDRNQQEMRRLADQNVEEEGLYDETPPTYTPPLSEGIAITHSQSYPLQDHSGDHPSHRGVDSLHSSHSNCNSDTLSSAQSVSMPALKDSYQLQNDINHATEEHEMLNMPNPHATPHEHTALQTPSQYSMNSSTLGSGRDSIQSSCSSSPHSHQTPHRTPNNDPWTRQTPDQPLLAPGNRQNTAPHGGLLNGHIQLNNMASQHC